MAPFKKCILYLFIISSCFKAQGADKYTDENRPYEFGFSIDGEQHRHEKKDENGIIMGEFGFITADGVYHVTVYATDENGNFKIISMKNIRVKPYPTSATNDVRKGHSLSLPSQADTSKSPESSTQSPPSYSGKPTQPQLTSKAPIANLIIEPARACSSCSLPTTTTVRPVYSEVNGGISPNTQNGFSSPSDGNYFSNKANVDKGSTEKLTYNNKAYTPQLNKINSGSSTLPATSLDKENLGPNNLQKNTGFKQNQPSGNVNQNYNEISRGLSPLQPSQGSNPAQFDSHQNSGNSINLSQRFGDGSFSNSVTGGSNTDNNDTPQNYNENSVGLTPLQPSQGKNSQPINSHQNSGNDMGQHSDKNPSTNSVNVDNNADSKNIAQNSISNLGSAYNQGPRPGERNPKQLNNLNPAQVGGGQNDAGNFEASNFGKPQKPVLISAQMQIVDKNTDINYKKPGEKEGLPNGLTKGDMENLLYTFNYTLAFQGHYEEGYRSGAKQGYYFVTGRNGVRTRVDYVADENGFRPKITQELLDIISDDVPKPETEKDEKYGLKGYEFKWLYFPVESKQQ